MSHGCTDQYSEVKTYLSPGVLSSNASRREFTGCNGTYGTVWIYQSASCDRQHACVLNGNSMIY